MQNETDVCIREPAESEKKKHGLHMQNVSAAHVRQD